MSCISRNPYLGMRPLQAHCHRGLGALSATLGQAERVRSELATAIAMYQGIPNPPYTILVDRPTKPH
jgi:hypothetical protein